MGDTRLCPCVILHFLRKFGENALLCWFPVHAASNGCNNLRVSKSERGHTRQVSLSPSQAGIR